MIYGYVRVSSKEQNEDRQIIALKLYGVKEKNIFTDKQSGKDFDRANYKKLISKLRKNDIIVIKSIDRLGRNYSEIIEQWRIITYKKNTDIVVLDMPLLDTTKNKDLFGTFISDIVLQILSFVAENERENIRQRQAEGIAAAKSKGVKFGRQQKYYASNYIDIYNQVKNKEISVKTAINIIGCSTTTYYRLVAEIEKIYINLPQSIL
ncbi:MAG: recombinase family protein [Clostridiales bacterium]|nr:recombinase family protein [Clostridiales bacterium]